MQFSLVQALSVAGSGGLFNDDRAGVQARHAWIIDGATDLGEPGIVGPRGGAQWLAGVADSGFAAAVGEDVRTICEYVADHVVRAWDEDRVRDPVAAWEVPSAAAWIARLKDDELEYGWLADCCGYLLRDGETVRLGQRNHSRPAETALAGQYVGQSSEADRPVPPKLETLREVRSRPGRHVLSVDRSFPERVKTGTTPCCIGDELVLMSDGFSALIEDYGLLREGDLAVKLREEGLHGLAQRLRAAEREDADCTRWPRFKVSDDATALWLRIV